MQRDAVWQVRPAESALVDTLSAALAIRRITAQVLVARGATSVESARNMLDCQEKNLHSPWLLPNSQQAVERLVAACQQGEMITVYGDYDVDGQTATALLVTVLRRLGANVHYYIPSRMDEGYGLNQTAVRAIAATGCRLLVSVDCGTNAAEEVALARGLGVDCIITDHHEPIGSLAPALALVNPKLPGSAYPWPQLAGVGVAYKLVVALAEFLQQPKLAHGLLDLVAVGTIADVVPLRDENRLLAHLGLQKMNQAPRPGLAALAAASSLVPGRIEAHNVAFHMAPRLNAGGRISHAATGVEMLLARSIDEALPTAERLDQENRARQNIEEHILATAREQAVSQSDAPVIVVAGDDWHPGVIGIVAARLVEQFGRPVCVLACEGDMAKGSARSVPGFDLAAALERNAHLLERFGGHAMAAGFTVRTDSIAALHANLSDQFRAALGDEPPAPILELDAWVDLSQLDIALLTELNRMGPFGFGNPAPVLACRSVTPRSVRTVGKEGSVLRLSLPVGRSQITAVGFRMGHLAPQLHGPCDFAFTLTLNEWQGQQSLELHLRDLRLTELGAVAYEVAAATDNPGSCVTAPQSISGILCHDAVAYTANRQAYIASLAQRDMRPYVWAAGDMCNRVRKELLASSAGCAAELIDAGTNWQCPVGMWSLVLCSPPVGAGWRAARAVLRNACSPVEVHLLYHPGRTPGEAALVAADWPDRDALAAAYRVMQQLTARGEALTVSGLAQRTGLSEHGAHLALQVFAELGLAIGNLQWRLLPQPSRKLDLTDSVSYNGSMVKRQEDGNLLAEKEPLVIMAKALAVWTQESSCT